MLKRFLSYYKPHRVMFFFDMLSSLAVASIGIVYPIITREMLNELIPNRQYRDIIFFGSLLLVLYLIRALLDFFIQYQGHVIGVKMQANMRSDMFNHLEKLPYGFYDGNETGKIMSRMTNDLWEVSELAHHGPENILISSISIVTAFVYLSTINIWLTLIIFACVPFLILISWVLRKRMRNAFMESRKSVAEINGALESSISGIRVTKAFTNAEVEAEKFEKGNSSFVEARRKSYKAMGMFHSSTTFVTNVFNVIVLIAGGLFLYNGDIKFGDYTAFILSVNLFLGPVNTLIGFMEQYQNGVTGFKRFLEIMDAEPELDLETATDIERVEGDINFKNVTYSYEGDTDVLHDLSLEIKKGEMFALVGPSGGGKTTICHLIPHFYNVEKGEIFIDGKEIHDITMKSLRQNIGIVQQDVYLFNASIRDNILYGRPGATEEEVIEAAKRANIHDYVLTLENGYDTIIGERGVKLSGGQKQRLSIARVFLKNPPILILDEATSALDNTTEILIQRSLDELCKGRTTIVVAHRLSTVKNADKIAVVSEGRITELGNHDELVALGGTYAGLYKLQFRDDVNK
ncbi:MAG: ABC transporter ATP-binding protein [Clostridia bacterium]|nr:ABC transporter ATP-binding protein [Clostridia bacterium]MBQ9703726.1 ABC transporter ATP-binding protein [Clostridia bacterium]